MELKSAVIRHAKASDADHLWPLVQDFAISYQPDITAFHRSFDQQLDRADSLVIVAEGDGQGLIGYLLANCHDTFFANRPVAWVEEVMVADYARGAGVGRLLMVEAEAWARSIPVAYIALASRRAGEFYQKLGYEASATFFKKSIADGSDS